MRLDFKEVFDCGNGRNGQSYQRMAKVCGYHCLGETAVNNWCTNFREEQQTLSDLPCPSKINIVIPNDCIAHLM